MLRRPHIQPGESLVEYLTRLDQWRAQGPWVPANRGTEEPFVSRSGHRLLYVWQERTGRHAYLDLDTDMVVTDEDAQVLLGHV